jgi:anti-anti-sigma factor
LPTPRERGLGHSLRILALVLRLDGGLFFATADALEDRIREVAMSAPGVTGIVLDCGGMDFIDSQGSAKMREILKLTEQNRRDPAASPAEAHGPRGAGP